MIKLPRNDEYGASPEVVDALGSIRLKWITDALNFAQRALKFGGEEGSRLSAIARASALFLSETRVYSPTPNLAPKEPKQAKCDSLVTLTRPIFPKAGTMTATQRSRLKKFSLVTQPTREKKAIDQTPISSAHEHDYLNAFNKNAFVTSRKQVAVDCSATVTILPASSTLLESPLQAFHVSNDVSMTQDNNPGIASVSSAKDLSIVGALLFVLCINENKKFLDNARKNGVNQSRMDLVACLKFLAAVGITNFPVYSVITDGTLGTIVSAHMKDHNVCFFSVWPICLKLTF